MAKGGDFEREIAKELSLWWTNGERDDVFWRTDGSGGRATNRFKQGKATANSYGDLTFIDPVGKPFIDQFLLELKRGYSNTISILYTIDGRCKTYDLFNFWAQAERDRVLAGRPWSILIFRRDRLQVCAMINKSLFNKITRWVGGYSATTHVEIATVDGDRLVVLPFYEFIKWLQPETIKRWENLEMPEIA